MDNLCSPQVDAIRICPHCEKAGKCTFVYKLNSLSKYLVADIRRSQLESSSKIKTIVRCPDDFSYGDYIFKKKGIVFHRGEYSNSGHYYTVVINSSNTVLTCDDASVKHMTADSTEEDICLILFDISQVLIPETQSTPKLAPTSSQVISATPASVLIELKNLELDTVHQLCVGCNLHADAVTLVGGKCTVCQAQAARIKASSNLLDAQLNKSKKTSFVAASAGTTFAPPRNVSPTVPLSSPSSTAMEPATPKSTDSVVSEATVMIPHGTPLCRFYKKSSKSFMDLPMDLLDTDFIVPSPGQSKTQDKKDHSYDINKVNFFHQSLASFVNNYRGKQIITICLNCKVNFVGPSDRDNKCKKCNTSALFSSRSSSAVSTN